MNIYSLPIRMFTLRYATTYNDPIKVGELPAGSTVLGLIPDYEEGCTHLLYSLGEQDGCREDS